MPEYLKQALYINYSLCRFNIPLKHIVSSSIVYRLSLTYLPAIVFMDKNVRIDILNNTEYIEKRYYGMNILEI